MRVSDDLKRGKANLQRWGWTKGLINVYRDLVYERGGVCAIGALMSNLEHEQFLNGSLNVSTEFVRVQHEGAIAYLGRALPEGYGDLAVWSYNDHHGNQERVEALYDRAIALAETDEAQAKVSELINEIEAWVNDPPPVEIKKGVDTLVGAC